MSLAEAITQTMKARSLRTPDVARRIGQASDRTTFYRLLSGATTEPHLVTLLGLCQALEVNPTDLLQLADLWPYRERSADALDVRLRTAFAQLHMLRGDDKQRAVRVVSRLAETWTMLAASPAPAAAETVS